MPRQKPSLEDTKSPPELMRSLEYVGIFTRVAQKLGVSPSHAALVARRKRTSRRVVDAIVQEVRRIDRKAERAA